MQPIRIVRVDVRGLAASAAEVDALARLALRLRRCGYQLRLVGPSRELLELIDLCGLSEALRFTEAVAADRTAGTDARCSERKSAP